MSRQVKGTCTNKTTQFLHKCENSILLKLSQMQIIVIIVIYHWSSKKVIVSYRLGKINM